MEWLNTNYPKAMKLDDYGMYGRDFPPEVIEYVHAYWIRTGEVYTRPVNLIWKEPKITNLKILTPEEAKARHNDMNVIKALDVKIVSTEETNKEARQVLS